MTDKRKKRTREFAAKTGMNYQAAHNVLHRGPATGGPSDPEDECPIHSFTLKNAPPGTECTCAVEFDSEFVDIDMSSD